MNPLYFIKGDIVDADLLMHCLLHQFDGVLHFGRRNHVDRFYHSRWLCEKRMLL
jgi:dTDP-D-glucose 4,6-dehydratase